MKALADAAAPSLKKARKGRVRNWLIRSMPLTDLPIRPKGRRYPWRCRNRLPGHPDGWTLSAARGTAGHWSGRCQLRPRPRCGAVPAPWFLVAGNDRAGRGFRMPAECRQARVAGPRCHECSRYWSAAASLACTCASRASLPCPVCAENRMRSSRPMFSPASRMAACRSCWLRPSLSALV